MWVFAWQNLISRPTRTALAVLGLTIPVLAFLGLFSISGGIRNLMGDTLARMQGLMVMRANSPAPVFSDLPPDSTEKVRKLRGARVVAPEVWRISPPIDGRGGLAQTAMNLLARASEPPLKSIVNMIVIEGMDIAEHQKLKSQAFASALLPKGQGGGRFLDASDRGKPHVVISTKIANDYPNADGSAKTVGQKMRIGSREFEIIGLYETGSLLLDVTLVMDIDTARDLLGLSPDMISTLDVEPHNALETDSLADRIEAVLPGTKVQRISQFNITVGAIMGKLDQFLFMAVALAMLVGGVGIANTMLMSTSERYIEFGVMRANGWSHKNILKLVTTESALLGLISGLLGGSIAVAIITTANRLLEGFSLKLSPTLLIGNMTAALLIAIVSGLYPAWKASRMTPMDAIRQSARL